MATVRAVVVVAAMLLHVGLGLAIVALLFPIRAPSGQRRLIRWWSRRVLAICRVDARIVGPLAPGTGASPTSAAQALVERTMRGDRVGAMLLSNHVSWLDIFVVHAMRPAQFVAKAEIGRWPLLGYLVDRTGAIFIERGKRHAVRDVNERAAASLRDGALIGVFPEGAVSDGRRLLPYHANLIQPAIDARVPIVVAGLCYREVDGRRTDATFYVGGISLLRSLVRIARHGPIVAELGLLDVIDGGATTRHAVARRARETVAAALGYDDDAADELSTVMVASDDAVNRDPTRSGMSPGTPLDPRDELL